MKNLLDLLEGGDVRSLGRVESVIGLVRTQKEFDELFAGLNHPDKVVVMRSADAIEKITRLNPGWLKSHKASLLDLLGYAEQKELKWHLALLAPRLAFTNPELGKVWAILTGWALDAKEGRIVRVNSIQGLSELLTRSPGLRKDFELTLGRLERENIPSISARIRILRKKQSSG